MQRFILIVLAVAVGTLVPYRLERVAVVLILVMVPDCPGEFRRTHLRDLGTPSSLSRGVAIGIVYVVISGVAWAGTVILLPAVSRQVADAVSRAPGYAESLRTWQGVGRGHTSG